MSNNVARREARPTISRGSPGGRPTFRVARREARPTISRGYHFMRLLPKPALAALDVDNYFFKFAIERLISQTRVYEAFIQCNLEVWREDRTAGFRAACHASCFFRAFFPGVQALATRGPRKSSEPPKSGNRLHRGRESFSEDARKRGTGT